MMVSGGRGCLVVEYTDGNDPISRPHVMATTVLISVVSQSVCQHHEECTLYWQEIFGVILMILSQN